MHQQLSEHILNVFTKLNPTYQLEDLCTEFCKLVADSFEYSFKDQNLFLRAFVHKSFAHEAHISIENNERLEFLGDSVLELVLSTKLIELNPELSEGELSKLRSSLVCEESFASLARFMNLNKYILVGKGEFKSEGYMKDSLLSDCFEAFIGAIYLDSDFITVQDFILGMVESYEKKFGAFLSRSVTDPKTQLQELVSKKYKQSPIYKAKQMGEGKNISFEVSFWLGDEEVLKTVHSSKKKGMVELAKTILEKELI